MAVLYLFILILIKVFLYKVSCAVLVRTEIPPSRREIYDPLTPRGIPGEFSFQDQRGSTVPRVRTNTRDAAAEPENWRAELGDGRFTRNVQPEPTPTPGAASADRGWGGDAEWSGRGWGHDSWHGTRPTGDASADRWGDRDHSSWGHGNWEGSGSGSSSWQGSSSWKGWGWSQQWQESQRS